MHGWNSTWTTTSWLPPTTTGSSRNRKWNLDERPAGRRVSSALLVVLFIVAETSSGEAARRQRSSVRYAGEHIHVGSMSDEDCPVKPPCYCTDSVTTTTQHASVGATNHWTANQQRHDDVTIVVAQRIACDSFPNVRRPRRKWSHGSGSRSRSRSLRRFPRFVESNVAVERHVMLSYSELTAIPGAAFHAIKVRFHRRRYTHSSHLMIYCNYPEYTSQINIIIII